MCVMNKDEIYVLVFHHLSKLKKDIGFEGFHRKGIFSHSLLGHAYYLKDKKMQGIDFYFKLIPACNV